MSPRLRSSLVLWPSQPVLQTPAFGPYDFVRILWGFFACSGFHVSVSEHVSCWSRGGERWLSIHNSSCRAPTSGRSQQPGTPAPEGSDASGLHVHLHACTYSYNTQMHIINKIALKGYQLSRISALYESLALMLWLGAQYLLFSLCEYC